MYPSAEELEQRWRKLVAESGGTEALVGRSGHERPLWRFDLGCRDPAAAAVLFTALIHGNEVVGSLALLDVITRLAASGVLASEPRRFVVMPVVNPDGLAAIGTRVGVGGGVTVGWITAGGGVKVGGGPACAVCDWATGLAEGVGSTVMLTVRGRFSR